MKNDITKQIFKFLKIEPEEVFRIKDNKNYFKLNNDLQLLYTPTKKYVDKQMWELCGPYLTLSNLLNGTVKILKITNGVFIMTTTLKGLEFDPGFGPYILAFRGSVEYLYSDINRFKNLSQKKMKFMQ